MGPQRFRVSYFVESPKGHSTRFESGGSLEDLRNARSETAVLAMLKKRHPGTEITIQNLEFYDN